MQSLMRNLVVALGLALISSSCTTMPHVELPPHVVKVPPRQLPPIPSECLPGVVQTLPTHLMVLPPTFVKLLPTDQRRMLLQFKAADAQMFSERDALLKRCIKQLVEDRHYKAPAQ